MGKNISQNLKWEEIKADIEIKVINLELKSGDKLPSAGEMSQIYKIAEGTAIKVFKALSKEGIIMKKESVGYFVKPFVTTTLKKKHINELKDKIKEVISHAKTINADYEEVKSMRELLDNYLDSFDSPQ